MGYPKLTVALILTLTVCGPASAQVSPEQMPKLFNVVRTYECGDYDWLGEKMDGRPYITITVYDSRDFLGMNLAAVKVGTETLGGQANQAGLEYRVDFASDWPEGDEGFAYAIVIKNSGQSNYYDFTLESRTGPKQSLFCRLKEGGRR
ncbi:MAG: hypothetical protein QNJ00_10165 [Woeseiaceae bacterium]|nr:hypothetical protein [Woeseiaceae bacterium]